MAFTAITEESIKVLVDSFYEKVRVDSHIGPIFKAVVGEGAQVWKPHLNRMYDFWSSIMLRTGRFHGNPMQKHRELLPFSPDLFSSDHFDVWLSLFAQTAREVYSTSISQQFIETSNRIASRLKSVLFAAQGNRIF